MCFKLFQISNQLPQHYRMATLQDVIEHLEDVLKALPGRGIANLVDGSLDEDFYSKHVTRLIIHQAFFFIRSANSFSTISRSKASTSSTSISTGSFENIIEF